MWFIGVILLLAGAGCLYAAIRQQRLVYAMMAAETLPVPALEQMRAISDELGAGGSFRKICEVVGLTHPGPHGLLRSELTGTECVWHGHRVQRRYKHYQRDSEGRTTVTTRTETVAEHASEAGFALLSDGRTIGVDHGGRRPDGVEQVADRFERSGPGSAGGGWLETLGAVARSGRDETIGYQYTEWVLRPGIQMYVLGEVHDATGSLVIAPPADRKHPFVLSTRSEAQLTASGRTRQRWFAWGGAGLIVLGLVMVVAGLVG
ncbi:E3 ubiquitin ligase family protein [Pseudonocardia hispaniensis]|uniref:RING-type E3 ubiquitin transferase n=1 Tax=Pseudonocardia hispaniensis TaxID=904933 RepID=A0ABW1J683_9PSEU